MTEVIPRQIMSILTDELEDLENDLDSAKRKIATNPGPLEEPDVSQVENYLTDADGHLKLALGMVAVAGVPTYMLPAALPAIAEHCRLLAQQAHASANGANPDNQLIADRLATIDWLVNVPDGYKDLAGIS